MTRQKDFLVKKTKKKADPIIIKLPGAEFECKPKRSGAAIINYIASAPTDEAEDGTRQLARILPFIYDSLKDSDTRKAFDTYIFDDDNDVEISDLVEISIYLVEEYMGGDRPTEQPEG